jgi:hypothetical protein
MDTMNSAMYPEHNVKQSVGTVINVRCPEHDIELTVDSADHAILVYGLNDYCDRPVDQWCDVININAWLDLVRSVIRINPSHNDIGCGFGEHGYYADNRNDYNAVDLIGVTKICYCQDRIQSFHKLKDIVHISANIIGYLHNAIGTRGMKSLEAKRLKEQSRGYRSLIETNDSHYDDYTKYFSHFVLHDMIECESDTVNENIMFLVDLMARR